MAKPNPAATADTAEVPEMTQSQPEIGLEETEEQPQRQQQQEEQEEQRQEPEQQHQDVPQATEQEQDHDDVIYAPLQVDVRVPPLFDEYTISMSPF